jgi:lysozyme family protein
MHPKYGHGFVTAIGALSYSEMEEYQTMFDTMSVSSAALSKVDAIVSVINAGRNQYQQIESATGVPWYFIGLIHHMESNNDFTKHLHNGDPLTARTVHVPVGRPVDGQPPFSFYESAVDAIHYQQSVGNWDNDFSISGMLYKLEMYNGFGYRNVSPPINSPYLWAGTNYYSSGLFTADHVYSPSAVSNQIGTAAILKRLLQTGNSDNPSQQADTSITSTSFGITTLSSAGLLIMAGFAYLLLFDD